MRLHIIAATLLLALATGCQTGPIGPGKPSNQWLGIAQRHETDFDRRTWEGTPVELIRRLLEDLPDRIDSAAEHRLARNILVAMADAPPGDDGSGGLVALRVAKLMRIGDFADAAALARAAPSPARAEEDAQREAEAELLAGEVEMACIDLRALAQRSSRRWVEDGVALCRARVGETAAAPPSGTDDLGVLVRISGQPLPSATQGASVAELAAVGFDPKLPPARRLQAAFGAAHASEIDGGTLAKILRAVPGNGRLSPGKRPPANGAEAAALYRAIEQASVPVRKLALAESGLLSAEGAVDQVSVALSVPLRTVKPGSDLSPLAARFARLFYALGDSAAAEPWADLAARSGEGAALWPYRALFEQAKPGDFEKWQKRTHLEPARLERILAAVSAFGAGPANNVLEVVDRAPPADLAAMDEASRNQRVGETTLRALAALGSEGPARADPEALRHVLADLDRVNLHDEPRALAFESVAAVLGRPLG